MKLLPLDSLQNLFLDMIFNLDESQHLTTGLTQKIRVLTIKWSLRSSDVNNAIF